MASYPQQVAPGAYVPQTDIFDVSMIYGMDINSQEFKEFLVRLRQSINDIAMVLNMKDTGFYYLQEILNGQVYFSDPNLSSTTATLPVPRSVFRKVIDFGTLPNATNKSVAHGLTITGGFSFTRIYGAATDPSTAYIPLPYASTTLNQNIQVDVDGTNVTITTGIDRTGFTTAYIVLEYIKF